MYGKGVLFSQFSRVVRSNVRYKKDGSTKRLLEFLADMPKVNSPRISEAQRQRQQIAKKADKYGPSNIYLQVLGSGARGAPNTLYLFTDQKRYMFNCGEQTQRLAHEHKVKLSRLDHIFVTSKTWRNIGGLPGLSLTLQDVGVPSITLHGPDGLDNLYNATRRFVIMKDMQVTMAKCSINEDYEDNVMNVKYVILGPNDEILVKDLKPAMKKQKLSDPAERTYEEFIHDETDYYKHSEKLEQISNKKYLNRHPKVPAKAPDPNKKKNEKVLHELQRKTHCTVSYICTLKKRLGTLDLAKCVELGVKPGPLLGQLKNGHDVVLPDGTFVLSKDVKTPDDPGPVFIVLDVPDVLYLKEQEFSAHFANGSNPPQNIPTLIVHFTPPDVFHSKEYQNFISLFGPSVRHLILNGQNCCLGSEAVHRTQHKLHLLDPDIFPLLKDVSVPAVWSAHPPIPKTNSPIRLKGLEELKNKIALAQFQNIINMESSSKENDRPPSDEPQAEQMELIAGRTLTMFHLRPRKQLDRSAEPKLHIQDYIQETMDVDGFVGSLEQFRRLVDSMRYAKRVTSKEYPKVVFLGTGSCIPSKTRNTSSIVLHIDENRSILLDCGEGTFGQLVRFYGPKRVNSFLRTLRGIYVSHLHADHHIGLIGVLQARRQAYDEINCEDHSDPVFLLAPGQIMSWLTVYDQQFERIRPEYSLIPNQSLLMDSKSSLSSDELTSAALAALGVTKVQTCLVPHCPNAFGVAIEIGSYKITYSGDTLPCENLVKLGADSTLLIHEATMEDELAEEARIKMHSTTTQAIEIGRQMNARYTVLTHFSQRYARLPRLNANILNDNNSVGIAFDNMQITMSDLELLPHMYAPLQLMFAEHCVEMELKAAHRARQKLRASARRSSPDFDASSRGSSCRCTASVPGPRLGPGPHYRDSHASRLRAEARGMHSVSPTNRGPQLSYNTSPARSRSQTPSKGSVNRNSPRSGNSGRSSPLTPRAPNDACPEQPVAVDLYSPRSLSLTSNMSRDGDSTDSYVVDTRSKTLSTAAKAEITANIYEKKSPFTGSAHAADTGYGKPLITPINKRLTLNRDYPRKTGMQPVTNDKLSPVNRCKSPMKRKADNRLGNSSTLDAKRDISATSTIRSACSSLRGSSQCAVKTDQSPMRSPVSPRVLKGSASSQNRLNVKNSARCNPAHASSVESTNPRSRGNSQHGPAARQPNKSSANNVSSATRIKSRDSSSASLQSQSGDNKKSPLSDTGSPTRPCSPTKLNKFRNPQAHASPEKKMLEPKEGTAELIRPQPRTRPLLLGRPNSAVHCNKTFKPKLEDIKSSFLLLNKKTSLTVKENVRFKDVSKPPLPIIEEDRKKRLMEIKKAFQSKRFWHESKYDKIEGLNWISWK